MQFRAHVIGEFADSALIPSRIAARNLKRTIIIRLVCFPHVFYFNFQALRDFCPGFAAASFLPGVDTSFPFVRVRTQ